MTALATAVRGRRDRLAFGESKQAAVALQTALRGTAARSQLTRSRRAATRVATAARGRQARAEFQTAKGAAVRLQGNLRRHQARQLLGGVTEARAPFLHLLHANEMVLLEALVLRQEKKASLLGGSGKKRRRLILTSGPRLLLVDPERVAGGAAEVPLEFDRGEYGRRRFAVVHAPNFELRPAGMARCDAAGASVGSALEAGVGQAGLAEGVDAFVCLVGEASALVGLLEDALDALVRGVWLEAAGGSAAVPLSSPLAVRSFAEEAAGRMLPVRRQGYLTKRALKSKMNWRKRWCVHARAGVLACVRACVPWPAAPPVLTAFLCYLPPCLRFVLHGTQLMYFKNNDDEAPKGVLELSGPVDLKPSEDPKPNGIIITTVGAEAPLMVHAASTADRDEWMDSLRAVMDSTQVMKQVRKVGRFNSRGGSAKKLT